METCNDPSCNICRGIIMPKPQPYFVPYVNPNIIIVPTIDEGPQPKKRKLDCESQITSLIDNTPNISAVVQETSAGEVCKDVNKTITSSGNINKNLNSSSWASNYLQSIGQIPNKYVIPKVKELITSPFSKGLANLSVNQLKTNNQPQNWGTQQTINLIPDKNLVKLNEDNSNDTGSSESLIKKSNECKKEPEFKIEDLVQTKQGYAYVERAESLTAKHPQTSTIAQEKKKEIKINLTTKKKDCNKISHEGNNASKNRSSSDLRHREIYNKTRKGRSIETCISSSMVKINKEKYAQTKSLVIRPNVPNGDRQRPSSSVHDLKNFPFLRYKSQNDKEAKIYEEFKKSINKPDYPECNQSKCTKHLKSVVHVKKNFTPDDDDLRCKLYRKKKENVSKEREKLIITVPNEKDDAENANTQTITINQPEQEVKTIKLVINVVCKKSDQESDKKDDKKTEKQSIGNTDLSFLDDFNVDDIVECLNYCEDKIKAATTRSEKLIDKTEKSQISSPGNMIESTEDTCKPSITIEPKTEDKLALNINRFKQEVYLQPQNEPRKLTSNYNTHNDNRNVCQMCGNCEVLPQKYMENINTVKIKKEIIEIEDDDDDDVVFQDNTNIQLRNEDKDSSIEIIDITENTKNINAKEQLENNSENFDNTTVESKNPEVVMISHGNNDTFNNTSKTDNQALISKDPRSDNSIKDNTHYEAELETSSILKTDDDKAKPEYLNMEGAKLDDHLISKQSCELAEANTIADVEIKKSNTENVEMDKNRLNLPPMFSQKDISATNTITVKQTNLASNTKKYEPQETTSDYNTQLRISELSNDTTTKKSQIPKSSTEVENSCTTKLNNNIGANTNVIPEQVNDNNAGINKNTITDSNNSTYNKQSPICESNNQISAKKNPVTKSSTGVKNISIAESTNHIAANSNDANKQIIDAGAKTSVVSELKEATGAKNNTISVASNNETSSIPEPSATSSNAGSKKNIPESNTNNNTASKKSSIPESGNINGPKKISLNESSNKNSGIKSSSIPGSKNSTEAKKNPTSDLSTTNEVKNSPINSVTKKSPIIESRNDTGAKKSPTHNLSNNTVKKSPTPESKIGHGGKKSAITIVHNLISSDTLEKRMLTYFGAKYTVVSLIHSGRYSKIVKCKDPNNSDCALKIACQEQLEIGPVKETMLKKFQKDIPEENLNCVRIIDGFCLRGHWCFLMDYYPVNLRQALQETKKSFHIDRVQLLTRQLVSAITILRNNNIIHSNIKPQHILLNSTYDRLKLCGFDEAKYSHCLFLLPNIGTASYRPPEVILGYSCGFSVDVWTTALIMFEMATGRKLFNGVYNNDILYKQMCMFGNVPSDMLQNSLFKEKHYVGNCFMRRFGHMGQQFHLISNFKRNTTFSSLIFKAYNRDWAAVRNKKEKVDDSDKLQAFVILLEKMLALHPKNRLPIEFVFANSFIFEMLDDVYSF